LIQNIREVIRAALQGIDNPVTPYDVDYVVERVVRYREYRYQSKTKHPLKRLAETRIRILEHERPSNPKPKKTRNTDKKGMLKSNSSIIMPKFDLKQRDYKLLFQ
jgi:hypothetical protein